MTEIILGPPGTGKTTSLLNIVDEELAAGTQPERIGYVSFTQRAAEEAVVRACARFNLEKQRFPYFRTLHSLCFRQLGLRSADVLQGKSFFEFAKWAGVRVTGRSWTDDGLLTGFEEGDRILFMENLSRIREIPLRKQYDEDSDGIRWSEVDRVSRALAAYKSSKGLMDFTDMLTEFVKSKIRVPLDVLLVDEAQDLSLLQWHVVEQLSKGCRRVIVAGDDDQAIYRWAGADVEHLISLPGDARVLGQSWRCPPIVQSTAHTIISNVKHRRPKDWSARVGGTGELARAGNFGDVDCNNAWDEQDLELQPVLVLARNAYVLREQVEPALKSQGIIYEKNGKSSLDLRTLRAARTWEDLRAGEAVTLNDAREMYAFISSGQNGIKRGFKKLEKFGDDVDVPVTMRELREYGGLAVSPDIIWHEALDNLPKDEMSYMLAARRRGERLQSRPRVRLSTIHSAKGGQAQHVVLMTEMAKRTFREMDGAPEDEARVWYVGVTRAKNKLTIVNSQTAQACPWL